jgi:hypothetical protein
MSIDGMSIPAKPKMDSLATRCILKAEDLAASNVGREAEARSEITHGSISECVK